MLDMKRIRKNPDELREALKARGLCVSIDELLALDEQRRTLLSEVEARKALRNASNKQIGIARKKPSCEKELAQLMDELRIISEEIERLDQEVVSLDASIDEILMKLPNFPHTTVPVGAKNAPDSVLHQWGTPRTFVWEPKTHQELARDLGILQVESDAHPPMYRGLGARLERAVSNCFLDSCVNSGYEEISTANPSAGICLADLFRETILDGAKLPSCYCACQTRACPSAETGAGGEPSFKAVELWKMIVPEQSCEALENLTTDMEKMLQLLELPYRLSVLSSGNLNFHASKTYRIEVWMPSLQEYVPAGICSDHGDFLARRSAIRYRETSKAKPQHVHTLEGGLSVGRIMAAILENCQNDDGTVSIPKVLVPSMGTDFIRKM